MNILSNVNFNSELAYEAVKARRNFGAVYYYMPLLKVFLEPNTGRWYDHELEGQRVICDQTNREYKVDSVNVHFYGGYYYLLILIDENGSSTQVSYPISCIHLNMFTNQNVFRTMDKKPIKCILKFPTI